MLDTDGFSIESDILVDVVGDVQGQKMIEKDWRRVPDVAAEPVAILDQLRTWAKSEARP